MTDRFVVPVYQALSDNGSPLPGAKLEFFEAGTTTQKDTFSDSAETTVNANPVIADGDGFFGNIYGQASYRVTLRTKTDVLVWERDNVQWFPGASDGVSLTYTTDISGNSLTPNKYISIWYDNNDVISSGAVWVFTGTTTAGNAGLGLHTDGYVYNANGDKYQISIENGMNVNQFGGGAGTDAQESFFNLAITYLNSIGGGEVNTASSEYFVDDFIECKDNVVIKGPGKYAADISFRQSNITTMDFSMFEQGGNALTGFEIRDIGLKGNRTSQASSPTNGSRDCYAVAFVDEGSTDIVIDNCYIREFGSSNDSGGGGVIFIPEVGAATSNVENIRVTNNHFGPNNNVPGVYVWSYIPAVAGTHQDIFVTGNTFEGGGDQNCVYIAGDGTYPIRNAKVDDNIFDIQEDCDVCVEINGCKGWSVSDNQFLMDNAEATGILIRGSTATNPDVIGGIVSKNVMRHEYGAGSGSDAISLTSFASGEYQDDISVEGNVITGAWSQSSSNSLIKVLKGSRNISVTGNTIGSKTTANTRAMDIGEASGVKVSDNTFTAIVNPFVLSTGTDPLTRFIAVKDNYFNGCGSNGGNMNVTTGGAIDMEGLVVQGNTVQNSISGATSFISITTAADTGNYLFNNDLDVPETSSIANLVKFENHFDIAANLENSWADGGNGVNAYLDGNGILHLRGSLAAGASGTSVTTLPVLMRPQYTVRFGVSAGVVGTPIYAEGTITTAGVFTIYTANSTLSLDGIAVDVLRPA